MKQSKLVSKKNSQSIFMLLLAFWALVVTFVIIVSVIVIPSLMWRVTPSFLLLSVAAILALGSSLILLAIRNENIERLLKKFLILTGASSIGALVSVFLHNIVYGLFIFFFGEGFWDRIGFGDEPFFFLLAIIVCPIGVLVGAIGSTVLFIKSKKKI